ncbi:MAG TPA: hypothetical protein VN325_24555 [Steroidobacteraceae bacterium]|nr:hypothetical protein [Steroidobacteraceae bacterium]
MAASRLWELGDKLSRVLGQRTDTPDNEVERAMGIEATRETLSGLESKRFDAAADPECD